MESSGAVVNFLLGWPRMHHLFALLCLVAVVYKFTILLVKRRAAFRSCEAFPGPPVHWLFGHLMELKKDGTELEKLRKWSEQYPCAYPLWFGPFICFLNIHDTEYVKTLLKSTEPKDDLVYRFITSWIGEGLLVSKGQRWFRHRRLLTPSFHYDVLKQYVKLMSDSAEIMLDKWESFAYTNQSFELFEQVSLMTLDSILKCAFSYNSNCQTEGGTNAYIKAVYELSDLVSLRLTTFPYHNDLIFYLSPHGFRYRKACRVAHSHTEEVIRKRKEALKEEKERERIQAKRNMDFLDILLSARDESQQGLSDEDLRAEVDTFMFEGHDTTTSGLAFILYCLACHPEHQKMCRDEIIDVLHGKDSIEWEDLNKIPYTTMCIKESLRLYPPVPGIGRKITKPMTFFDGRTLPAGFRVGTSVYAIHRNAAIWENPNVSEDNFQPFNMHIFLLLLHDSTYVFPPNRNCIGQKFAMNEMKVVTALTLKRYQLSEDPTCKPKIIPRLVLRSVNGIHIKIKPVDPQE
uniref:Cytochrome P450 4B1-like n=1 Tax=Scophthalmus maximus TaxID=52904 RepID=A0A8D3C196_SCOMX